MFKKIFAMVFNLIIFIVYLFSTKHHVLAAGSDFDPIGTPSLPAYVGSWGQFGTKIIDILAEIAGIVFVGVLLVGAVIYITSGETGGEKSVEIGRKAIISAIVGLVIVALSWGIIKFVAGLW